MLKAPDPSETLPPPYGAECACLVFAVFPVYSDSDWSLVTVNLISFTIHTAF